MRIIIDADACPRGVKNICTEIAAQYQLPLTMVSDRNHDLEDDGSEVITVDSGRDASDFKIVEITTPQDIVVTHDYGLASMVLEKAMSVIHPDGFIYSAANIDELLYKRYLNQKLRKSGHARRIKKRSPEEDEAFRIILLSLVKPMDSIILPD
ncbi:MAG: DUF188 domain-containing protein [Eubacterium sp.]|nr:DUF188 domain-containing protein [Eubacterium sp.]